MHVVRARARYVLVHGVGLTPRLCASHVKESQRRRRTMRGPKSKPTEEGRRDRERNALPHPPRTSHGRGSKAKRMEDYLALAHGVSGLGLLVVRGLTWTTP